MVTLLQTLRRLNAERFNIEKWTIDPEVDSSYVDAGGWIIQCGSDANAAFIAHLANSCTKLLDVVEAASRVKKIGVNKFDGDTMADLWDALKPFISEASE